MLPDEKVKCPYTGFSMTCFEGVVTHKCPKWIRLQGDDPNSGKKIDEFACADAWLPILIIESAQQSRQTGAAVESFRNEMVKMNAGPIPYLGALNGPPPYPLLPPS